jgi:hypothetical protein
MAEVTLRRSFPNANSARFNFTLISRNGKLETAFELDHNARGSFPK